MPLRLAQLMDKSPQRPALLLPGKKNRRAPPTALQPVQDGVPCKRPAETDIGDLFSLAARRTQDEQHILQKQGVVAAKRPAAGSGSVQHVQQMLTPSSDLTLFDGVDMTASVQVRPACCPQHVSWAF